jgi:DNA processing protein
MSCADRLRLAFCGLHPDRAARLVRDFGSAGAVLTAIAAGRVQVPNEARRVAAQHGAATCLRQLRQLGVRALFRGGPGYSAHLGDLPGAPDVLLARGVLPAAGGVAIVGTRLSTRYGLQLARAYGRACSQAGWPVISGLARGVDAEAHRGVLEAGGVGVAVQGCGPDRVYPAEHRGLHDALLAAGGAVVTEYPPGTPPEGWRFPPRNRIISGLAAAVVVVEAGETGGALITAAAALEHGRTVFAVPGDVCRPSSRGCNLLIRDGAVPVFDPEDLVEALSLILGNPGRPSKSGPREIDPGSAAVLAAIPVGGATMEELAATVSMPTSLVLATLSRLEVAGLLERRGGVVFVGR